MVEGVGRLQGGDDALRLTQEGEALEGLLVGHGDVLGAAGLLVEGVLRADAGVVEAGGDGVRLPHLASVVLEEVGVGAVEDAGPAVDEGGGVTAG